MTTSKRKRKQTKRDGDRVCVFNIVGLKIRKNISAINKYMYQNLFFPSVYHLQVLSPSAAAARAVPMSNDGNVGSNEIQTRDIHLAKAEAVTSCSLRWQTCNDKVTTDILI